MKPKSRFIFIDIARSIAILLMLEGHFISDSLIPNEAVYTNYSAYHIWAFIRGFTSPIFLTVTGIVFVYLLLGNNHLSYFKNIRVKKGFKRGIELLFWGYLLQYYAFHVLQCIGVGIFSILLLYGLYKVIRFVPLWVYFFMGGTLIFSTYMYLGTIPKGQYWPAHAPSFIQNMFVGKYSIFPILPRMGYTLYGAMFGVLLHDFKDHVKKWGFAITTVLIGIFLFVFLKDIFLAVDRFMGNKVYHIYKLDWLYECLGMVMIVLGTLMIIEKIMGEIKPNLFLKIGQNTLTIYILHMVILYGSITGFGLNRYFHHALSPYQAISAVLFFLIFFFLLIHYLEVIKQRLKFILEPLKKTSNSLFNIKE
jgi:fucose 4-O-acetylase-like acetyltransferase